MMHLQQILDELRQFSTPELCDGATDMQTMDYHIHQMVGTRRIVGTAFPIQVFRGVSGIIPDALHEVQPGQIIVIAGLFIQAILHIPNRLISADIADFQTERFLFATDSAVPELLGFLAVADDIAQFVDFDFTVGVPLAVTGGAVQTQEFDQFQTFLADFDGLESLFGVEHGLLVVIHDLA